MSVKFEKFLISSKGFDDVIDITSKVQNIVSLFDIENAIANIFSLSSCTSLITLDSEPNLAYDLAKILESIVPINKIYQHDNFWHDGNAYSHLRASILGNNITLPVIGGKIMLDSYQQIVMIDFDNKPSQRQVIVTVKD